MQNEEQEADAFNRGFVVGIGSGIAFTLFIVYAVGVFFGG